MRDLTTTIVFGWYPYLVLAVFLLGNWLRFDRTRTVWPSGASELLLSPQVKWAAGLFLGGVLALFFGHLIGLLTPITLFEAIGISHGFKQTMAIVLGGIAGTIGFAGIVLLLHRAFGDTRTRALFSFADLALLLLVFTQLTLGLGSILVSLKYIDGCAMVKFMTWAQGILTFDPGASTQIAGVPMIFKLHIFLGMTILLVFPFTRAVNIWGLPAWYFGRSSAALRSGAVG